MTSTYRNYFDYLEADLAKQYQVAIKARSKGIDASTEVEPKVTHDIAERVEKMLGPPGITLRMRELEQLDRRDIAFKVAEEICLGKFGEMEKDKAADQAIRTALAILTEGVTIAPLEGIPKIEIKRNPDHSQFLSVYFAGPIRPAGGTAQALTLVVADVVRHSLGLEKWQANEQVVQRFVEEVRLYERTVRRFQYHITDDDIELAMRSLPVEPTGVSTDPFEISNYRDVPGIETNRLRGGALIVVVDGIIGRARKLYGNCEKLGIPGWEWLTQMGRRKLKTEEEKEEAPAAAFMEEIIVGRPVFSFPGAVGGFRLRYGRARNTGLAANGVHPATMIILNKFLATGVQMRTELPGKSTATCPVDSIEPPIARIKDGSVIRIDSVELAEELLPKIDKILYLGDYLSNAGDWVQNNKPLLPACYDENQWLNDLEKIISLLGFDKIRDLTDVPIERIQYFLANTANHPSAEEALTLTKINLALHPRWNYLWTAITSEDVLNLRTQLLDQWRKGITEIENNPSVKILLDNLLIPHKIRGERIIFSEDAKILESVLALNKHLLKIESKNSLELVNKLAGFQIRNKAPVFVGARMGRPEKAKERKMNPYVHSLFPVAEAGGPQRDILRAEKGTIKVEIVQRQCIRCGNFGYTAVCQNCGGEMEELRKCSRCGTPYDGEKCPRCKGEIVSFQNIDVDLRREIEDARKLIGGSLPTRIKCVKRLMNEKRVPEPLAKGILRARYDLSVFKDGTLRFDLTDLPLTHFKPCEIGTSIDKLRLMGYNYDIQGNQLTSSDQMLELKVQDILLPEECGDYLVKASKFIDDELKDLYKNDKFYNAKTRDDLIGTLLLGLAPHTSAAITGRLIGFTKVRNCYAHPYWHAAKRRNCDGDEDSIMLVLDALLNFSKSYLPQQSGGLMDAPLYVIPALLPGEVDKEALNVEADWRYSSEFYKLCAEGAGTSSFSQIIDLLGSHLGTEAQFEGMGYTNEVSDINLGAHHGAYNTLHTMMEKLDSQLELAGKLRAVDQKTVALKILNSHFMKDIVGNLRAYTAQIFRCTKCNRKYRRPPLTGKCIRCGGPIQLTVHKGGIEKYLNPALSLVKKYDLDQYYLDRLILIKDEIGSLFKEELESEDETSKQFSLTDFMKPTTPKKTV